MGRPTQCWHRGRKCGSGAVATRRLKGRTRPGPTGQGGAGERAETSQEGRERWKEAGGAAERCPARPHPPAPPSSDFCAFEGALWTQVPAGLVLSLGASGESLSPLRLSVLISKMGLKSQSSESWGDRAGRGGRGFRSREGLCVICDHRHTHTCTRLHTYACARAYTRARTRAHICTPTHVHGPSCTLALGAPHTCSHAPVFTGVASGRINTSDIFQLIN